MTLPKRRWLSFVCELVRSHLSAELPEVYRSRPSCEELWLAKYSPANDHLAEAILTLLCDVFGFDQRHRFQFSPDDRLPDIYCQIYGKRRRAADAMEIETLNLAVR